VDEWLIEEALGGGRVSFIRKFIDGLQRDDFRDAAALIKVLRIRGNELREPQSKALGDGLFELRGRQVRIFYVFRPGRRIVLLDGFIKKRSKTPTAVLERMRKLQSEIS